MAQTTRCAHTSCTSCEWAWPIHFHLGGSLFLSHAYSVCGHMKALLLSAIMRGFDFTFGAPWRCSTVDLRQVSADGRSLRLSVDLCFWEMVFSVSRSHNSSWPHVKENNACALHLTVLCANLMCNKIVFLCSESSSCMYFCSKLNLERRGHLNKWNGLGSQQHSLNGHWAD